MDRWKRVEKDSNSPSLCIKQAEHPGTTAPGSLYPLCVSRVQASACAHAQILLVGSRSKPECFLFFFIYWLIHSLLSVCNDGLSLSVLRSESLRVALYYYCKLIAFISLLFHVPVFASSQAAVLQADRRVCSADRAPQKWLRSGFQMQKPPTGHRSTHWYDSHYM